MKDLLGTRNFHQVYASHPESRMPNNKYTRDVGMSKRVLSTAAVMSSTTLTDAAQTWTVFSAGDPVTIFGTSGGLNNGDRMITAVSASSITVDFPFKTETVSGYTIEVRTL